MLKLKTFKKNLIFKSVIYKQIVSSPGLNCKMNLRFEELREVRLRFFILLLVLGFSLQPCIAQTLRKINIDEIPQRRIRKYIVSRSIDKMDDFSSIHASWNKDIDKSDFNVIEKTFFLNCEPDEAWEFYRHANVFNIWNGKSVRFGLLISKCSNSIISTSKCSFHEIDTGDVYFLNLKLMKGLLNVQVAFEIISIDQDKRLLEFSYIENNKSSGKQSLQFLDDGPGRTKIIHRSYFKSNSFLRDKIFYPYFHKKFITEFHSNMNHIISSKNLPFTIIK
jgi:hypothetical protein